MGYEGREPHKTMPITLHDLRALLHWATVGVAGHRGGSYANEIEAREGDPGIIQSYANDIGFKLPFRPVFKKD